jgi:hypothetical protein
MAGKIPTTVTTNAVGAVTATARAPRQPLEQTTVRQINSLQAKAAEASAPARAQPRAVSGSTTLMGISFTNGQTQTLSHFLGRAYQGWAAHSPTGAPATLYATTSADPTRYLALVNGSTSSFTCNIEVW